MKAEKIEFNGENRIQVSFPFDQEAISKIRQISGALWSKTNDAWNIPYNKEAYNQLIRLFPDIKIDQVTPIEKERAPSTCLLYTSPSPRDRQKSRMPSSA